MRILGQSAFTFVKQNQNKKEERKQTEKKHITCNTVC